MTKKENIEKQKRRIEALASIRGYSSHAGIQDMIKGVFIWSILLASLGSIGFFFGALMGFIGSSIGFLLGAYLGYVNDLEDVDRNTMVTVENTVTNEAVCVFRAGKHWMMFTIYEIRNFYSDTSFRIEIPLKGLITRDGVTIVAGTLVLRARHYMPLLFEDLGNRKAKNENEEDDLDGLQFIKDEAEDQVQNYIPSHNFSVLEKASGEEFKEFVSKNKQLEEIFCEAGIIWEKVDVVGLTPDKEYLQSKQALASRKEKNKAVASEVRNEEKMAHEYLLSQLVIDVPNSTKSVLYYLNKAKKDLLKDPEMQILYGKKNPDEENFPGIEKDIARFDEHRYKRAVELALSDSPNFKSSDYRILKREAIKQVNISSRKATQSYNETSFTGGDDDNLATAVAKGNIIGKQASKNT